MFLDSRREDSSQTTTHLMGYLKKRKRNEKYPQVESMKTSLTHLAGDLTSMDTLSRMAKPQYVPSWESSHVTVSHYLTLTEAH